VEGFAMKKRWYAAAVVAVALVLLVADSASAQRRLRGRRSGGYDGGYSNGPGYYGSGMYGGYAGPGYGPGFMPGYAYAPNGVTDTTSLYYQPGTQPGAAGYGADDRSALIDVRVPPDARVTFDGDATAQAGPNRLFSSPPLDRGRAYHYTVKARWTQNGQPVERTRRVEVRAGQRSTVDFTQDQGRDLNRDRDRIEE
jgi:uncharacterized protein (TIGR03000 family)